MNPISSYLQELNDVQRNAVTHTDGPVLVVAGPGSGKTRVLTYRIAHLINKGVAPWEILTLTFTNKAAREMKDRIEKVVGARANKVWAGTFHSIFARILRVEADKIGYPPNFTIYDTDDSKSLINAILNEMHLDKEKYNVNQIRARISSAKSNLITPKLYVQQEDLMEQDRQARRPLTHKIYEKYVARCKLSGAMDFDDLLYRLYELWQKNPDGVLDKYREKFPYVLVDEFQDTNHLQYAIIRKLVDYPNSPRNICVVGDDAQSIYAFRGATIQNILDFEQDFKPYNIQTFKLEQNYRSTEHIVQAANEIIQYNARQIPKTIWSDKGSGHRIKIIKAATDGEEGKRVVDTILEQKNRYHLSNSDIAILYRTNSQSRVFEEYLRRYNILYKIYGGLSFYQRKEVKDLVAYLRLVVNPGDDEALRRIINFPKRAIGDTTVEKISDHASQNEQILWKSLGEVSFGGKTQTSLNGFIQMIRGFREQLDRLDAYQLAKIVYKESGLEKEYAKEGNTQEGQERVDNINSLLDGISAFVDDDSIIDTETIPDKSLASFLQSIALLTDQDEKQDQNDRITLMSVHAAKGLEFKSVFVVGLEEKLFPSFLSMESPEAIDEERRLFYVAITRAEQFLTLTFANNRYRYGQMRFNDPSRFLEEIPRQHVESTANIRSNTGASFEKQAATPVNPKASVSGYFNKPAQEAYPKIDPRNFKASPIEDIKAGMKVLHLKFGEGKVVGIDGNAANKVATVHFSDAPPPQPRRIMLKFAKLQILEG
ncbi:MAG TPA: UvrD-helicase domain-containing protein [Saprospiraceae bacterium]|nr:UvrD-helicase domain-containing protein [Saprospiraceae bacterium]HMQ85023.1 UvrD-helicase domain-containing protein [Saprospiraceae bacterium]